MSVDGDVKLDFQVESPSPDSAEIEEGGLSFLQQDKEEEPCENFRLDTTGGFGMCKCGHPRTSHGVKQTNKAAQLLTNLRAKNNSGDAREDDEVKGDKPCGKFRLDTTATGFGICKCGFKRADHEISTANNAKRALERLKESNLDKYKETLTNLNADEPCGHYRVDTAAPEFGTCVCGFKKDDHISKEENVASKLLKNLKEKNKDRHEKEDQAAQGIVAELPVPEETVEDPVQQLTQAEMNASDPNKAKKKKKRGRCVIS